MRRRVRRLAIALFAGVGTGFLLVAYTPLANLLATSLQRDEARAEPLERADIIIVLSGGRYLDGSLNEASLRRTVTGVRLYRQGLAPALLFSGGPCCGGSASALMARLATELGVPPSAILLEERSGRTYESAVETAALLRERGMRSAILVTSPLHMRRARLAFEAAGVPVNGVRAAEKNLLEVSGVAERIAILGDAIHEYAGLLVYRLRGWISR